MELEAWKRRDANVGEEEEDEVLYSVFRDFAMFGQGASSRHVNLPLMDSRQLQRLCRDCKLVDNTRLTKVDIDLIFIQVRGANWVGARRLDYVDFLQCLQLFAQKKECDLAHIVEQVRRSTGPSLNSCTTPDKQLFTSPLRETPPTLKQQLHVVRSNNNGKLSSPDKRGKSRVDQEEEEEWYEVENPDPQGPDELVYYVNARTNETRWTKPRSSSNRAAAVAELLRLENDHDNAQQEHTHVSVFDKLTDPKLFTGTQRYRVKYGSPTQFALQQAFRGNTNTGTDEVFTHGSQLVRRSWC